MANQDIGQIRCPISGEMEPLRRCATGKRLFYWNGAAGKITPNMAMGQRYIYDNATFNDQEDKRQLAKQLGITPATGSGEMKAGINPETPAANDDKPRIRETTMKIGGKPVMEVVNNEPPPAAKPANAGQKEMHDAFDNSEGFWGLQV